MVSRFTLLASDFGGMVWVLLAGVALFAGGSLVLAAVTEAILARVYRRKWNWILVVAFAVGWFAVVWAAFQWWLSLQPMRSRPTNAPPAVGNPSQQRDKQGDAPAPP